MFVFNYGFNRVCFLLLLLVGGKVWLMVRVVKVEEI